MTDSPIGQSMQHVSGIVTLRFSFDVLNAAPSYIAQIVQETEIGGSKVEVEALTLNVVEIVK